MSGPIVRKYGFPNFEQIFGQRELQHGVDETNDASSSAVVSTATEPAPAEVPAKPAPKTRKKKT